MTTATTSDLTQPTTEIVALAQANGVYRASGAPSPRARYLGTAADMAVAMVLAFGSAAAGSRRPVILIAAYYAAGALTGTSPMVALLGQVPEGSGSSKLPLGRVDQLERVDA